VFPGLGLTLSFYSLLTLTLGWSNKGFSFVGHACSLGHGSPWFFSPSFDLPKSGFPIFSPQKAIPFLFKDIIFPSLLFLAPLGFPLV